MLLNSFLHMHILLNILKIILLKKVLYVYIQIV